jgi:hypothetical protein
MAVGLILTVAALFFQRSPRTRTTSRAPSLALALNVRSDGNRLRLTWNRKAPSIGAGSWGVLSIIDGGPQPVWKLDTTQLIEGTIVYWPATNDVSFRLQVFQNGITVSESIRSLGMPPSRAAGAPLAPASEPPERAIPVQDRQATSPRRAKSIRQRDKGRAPANVKSPTTLNSHARIPGPVLPPAVPGGPDPLPANQLPEVSPVLEVSPLKAVAQEPVDTPSTATVEPTHDSRFDRVIGKIPLIRRLRKAPGSVPPRPLRQVPPVVPAETSAGTRAPVPIDVQGPRE